MHLESSQTSKMEPFVKIQIFRGLFSGAIERNQLLQMG